MSLQEATRLHQAGDLAGAIKLYNIVLKNGKRKERAIAVMNYGALLRKSGKVDEAIKLYESSQEKEFEPGILNNLGNCLLEQNRVIEALGYFRKSLSITSDYVEPRVSLWKCLSLLGLHELANRFCVVSFAELKDAEDRQKLMLPYMESLMNLKNKRDISNTAFRQACLRCTQLVESKPTKGVKDFMLLAQLWNGSDNPEKAYDFYQLAEQDLVENAKNDSSLLGDDFKAAWSTFCWNLSIGFLRLGLLDKGWSLYDHGLRVAAAGQQKYQRSLKKFFTSSELRIWDGNCSPDLKLLVVGEQGIGDSMMFATLIPQLSNSGLKITFVPGDRLVDIYKRSLRGLEILTHQEMLSRKAEDFDAQIPAGTLPRLVCSGQSGYLKTDRYIKSDMTKTRAFREELLRLTGKKFLVGISWSGGGKKERVPKKSVDLRLMASELLRCEGGIVSLQYGNTKKVIDLVNQKLDTNIICREDVNPLQDMDTWLSLVDACDVVLTVANTTVHGSCGLGKETYVVLTEQSDWRWIKEKEGSSYWYPSARVKQIGSDKNWKTKIAECVDEINTRFCQSSSH